MNRESLNVFSLYDDRSWLYDAAFSWDPEDEAAWLVERLGPGVHSILEPGCGSGRLFPAFARRGIAIAGVNVSAAMLERARERMRSASLPLPLLVRAHMAEFDLGAHVDGAVCPINTFAYLPTVYAARCHLASVRRHLGAGGRYLVQLDIRSVAPFRLLPADDVTCWEVDSPRGRLRCSWFGVAFDHDQRIETEVSRFELVSGPDAGYTFEDRHEMRVWDWAEWTALVSGPHFRQAAAHDGNSRAPLDLGPSLEGRPLVWHELVAV
jgi:SAM-dependent methyltransferase